MSTKTTTPRTRLSPEQRAAEILDAATEIARKSGLGALSVRAVAERAGVAAGLVTHYFTLDELVAKAYVMLATQEHEDIVQAFELLSTPGEKIDAVLDTSMGEEYAPVTFVWVESWAISRRNSLLKSALREHAEAWHRLVADIITEGCRAGEFSAEDAEETAWQLLALIDGTSAHALMRELDDPTTAKTLRQSAASILHRTGFPPLGERTRPGARAPSIVRHRHPSRSSEL